MFACVQGTPYNAINTNIVTVFFFFRKTPTKKKLMVYYALFLFPSFFSQYFQNI